MIPRIALTHCVARCSEISHTAGRLPSARSLGMKLHHHRGRIINGRAIDSIEHKRGVLWVVREVACETSTAREMLELQTKKTSSGPKKDWPMERPKRKQVQTSWTKKTSP